MLVLHDRVTLHHKTVELLSGKLIPALESPSRIVSILEALHETAHVISHVGDDEVPKQLTRCLGMTHDTGYVCHLGRSHAQWVAAGHIEQQDSILPECFPVFSMPHQTKDQALVPPKDVFARSSFYAFDMSSGIMKDTYYSAMASASLAIRAALMLSSTDVHSVSPKLSTILCLCRPPGHHCDTRHAGGYCYLNNAVLAVQALQNQCSDPPLHDTSIAVLDIDFHHGNGTQSYFYDRQVTYVSIHGKDEYPYYSGDVTEKGAGKGEGYNHNFPLPSGSSFDLYTKTLTQALDTLQWTHLRHLVISLGFDTFHLDPLGSFSIDIDDYRRIGKDIARRTKAYEVQTTILLEGGYVVDKLGHCLVAFLKGWEEA